MTSDKRGDAIHLVCRVAVSRASYEVEQSTMESDPILLDLDEGISTNSLSRSSSLDSASATTLEDISGGGCKNGKHYNIRADKKNAVESFFFRSTCKNVEPPVNRSQKKEVRFYQKCT